MLDTDMKVSKFVIAAVAVIPLASPLGTGALADRSPEQTARSLGAILGYGMYCKADNRLLREFAKVAQIVALAPALDLENREIKDKERAKELGEHFKAGWQGTQHTAPPFGCEEVYELLKSDPRRN